MSKCLNTVALLGNVGRDPERVDLQGGTSLAKFSLATSRPTGKDKPEQTQWHTIVAWGGANSKLADLVLQLVKKGSRVHVTGEIRYRQWEKDGEKRTTTEIHMTDFILCAGDGTRAEDSPYAKPAAPKPARKPAAANDFEDFPEALEETDDDDSLPFDR